MYINIYIYCIHTHIHIYIQCKENTTVKRYTNGWSCWGTVSSEKVKKTHVQKLKYIFRNIMWACPTIPYRTGIQFVYIHHTQKKSQKAFVKSLVFIVLNLLQHIALRCVSSFDLLDLKGV